MQLLGSKFNRLTVTEGATSKGALIEMLYERDCKTKSTNLAKTLNFEKHLRYFSFTIVKLGSSVLGILLYILFL